MKNTTRLPSKALLEKAVQQLFNSSNYELGEVKNMVFKIMEKLFSISKAEILANEMVETSQHDLRDFKVYLKRVRSDEPIQYILEQAEFYGRTFEVNPTVLIPRPETEELVELIIQDYRDREKKDLRILDVGTGSGCIAITLGKEFPESQVYGLDISERGLEIAENNAQMHGVNMQYIVANMLKPFHLEMPKFDIIVSNPPYLTKDEKNEMKKNVLKYEPHRALFVNDENPLIFYEFIADFAENYLVDHGRMYFEINENFGQEMKDLMEDKGFYNIHLIQDLSKKDRMVKCEYQDIKIENFQL